MFEEYYTGIDLTDAQIYYLAIELKLQQIVGVGIDIDSLNPEMKTLVKSQCYDSFEAEKIIQMNFSGNVTVKEPYATYIKNMEHPNYCVVVQITDFVNETNQMQKLYLNEDKWMGLSFIDENSAGFFEFSANELAQKFVFAENEIYSKNIVDDESIEYIDNIDTVISKSDKLIVVTEYQRTKESYETIQKIYVYINNDWKEVQEIDNQISLVPITSNVTI